MKIKVLLVIILLVATFTRFYQLNTIPAGLTNDEADIGYDAYSLLVTGHDQWGAAYPLVSFQGFGDFRPVLYTYLVIPSIALFGLNQLAVRIPSALAGVISVYLLYVVIGRLFDKRTGVLAAGLFAISPWAIGLSHIGIESNVAITFFLAGLLFLFNKNK